MKSKERKQDVAEEGRGLHTDNDHKGPWFGRLRRQGPPTTAHNGREGHGGTVESVKDEISARKKHPVALPGRKRSVPESKEQD